LNGLIFWSNRVWPGLASLLATSIAGFNPWRQGRVVASSMPRPRIHLRWFDSGANKGGDLGAPSKNLKGCECHPA
jgi:hypothetical protein